MYEGQTLKRKFIDKMITQNDSYFNKILLNLKKDIGERLNILKNSKDEKWLNLIEKKNVIDSLEVARNKFPGTSNSLDALCKKFNIDLSKRIKHNALLDCDLLREVYINLLDAKEPKFNLSNNINENNIETNQSYNKQVLNIPEREIKLHKEFLKKEIKKNFY